MDTEIAGLLSSAKDLGVGGAVFLAFVYTAKGIINMMVTSITNREQTIQTFFGQAVASLQKATDQNNELIKIINDLNNNQKAHAESQRQHAEMQGTQVAILAKMQEDINTQNALHRVELVKALNEQLDPLLKLIQKPNERPDAL